MTKLARWCLAGRQTFLFSSHVFFLPYKRECSTKYLTRPGFIREEKFFFSSIRLYISRGQRHFWFFFPSPHSSTRFGKIAIAVGMKSAQGKVAGGIKKKKKSFGLEMNWGSAGGCAAVVTMWQWAVCCLQAGGNRTSVAEKSFSQHPQFRGQAFFAAK